MEHAIDNNLTELWTKALGVVQTEISKANFITLFKKTALLSLEKNVATIAAPSSMIIDLIKKRFLVLIKTALEKQTNHPVEIIFIPKTIVTMGSFGEKAAPLFAQEPNGEPTHTSVVSPVYNYPQRLRVDYTFQTLAVSSSNQLAFVAATTVSKKPGTTYNPLFIYGPVGVGKTHLMQAIASEMHKTDPRKKIIYCTSEEFTNDVVESIRSNQTQIMKRRFRSTDLFIVDDVQFIAGKDRVQEELFHTFNILIDKNAQIVLSSDRPPHEIKKLEKRLSSRFSGGLTVDIESPDFELRCAILLIKAKKHGFDLSMETAKKIAENIDDTRLLEGALLRLITESETQGKEIGSPMIEKVVGAGSLFKKPVFRIEDIMREVCAFYDIKPTQIKGERRNASLAKARQVCMYLLKKELRLPFTEIGNILGGRDHTTIMHGVEKIERLISLEKPFDEEVREIIRSLRA
ncbi:MAG: chromosomal replication initiator protein DnaA [Candidatus Levybacteria bacterium RIFCSPHIGHO2_02_FULL_42_12]|nr:MAG: chromosomal replication initiator protein DnaA [Candidatus Levybacteria bacterium RIFCSPHIGHO2_02_FULL_42_12]OGH42997.1 MAG: chromosomal replication initiator protein DnaA [Candidatus Levybacteria bacterium RIFCSPLOWO2_01_FULL_42_15]